MPVPDILPDSSEPTEAMRRHRMIENIKKQLVGAVLRINEFMENHDDSEAIKKLHFAPTDVTAPDGEVNRIRYYSVWDSSCLRILETGQLARAKRDEPKFSDILENGADESVIVTLRELEMDRNKYNTARLADIVLRLEKILAPKETPQ